ncbi:MAG: hypothetical protein RJA70_686 [Pseudomonadota bacterium]
MSESAVAERYGRAIFELGTETGQLTPLVDQLRKFDATLKGDNDLLAVLTSPVVLDEQRDGVIAQVARRLGCAEAATNAIRLLARRHRLRALGDINKRLLSLTDEKNGVVRVVVTMAKPLTESYFQRLTVEVEKSTGRKAIIERREDPTLISGVIVQIGDNTVDGSIRGRLEEFERQLLTAQ